MNGIFELTFLADGVGRFVSKGIKVNARCISVSIALSAAGSISIERSLDGTSWSPVSEFSKSLAAAGSIEFGLSDIAIGQQLRFVSTVAPTSIKVLA